MSLFAFRQTSKITECIGRLNSLSLSSQILTPQSKLFGVVQVRGAKDDLRARGIEWKEPPKLPAYHPEKTGDLEPFQVPDVTCPTYQMHRYALEEYDEASPIVQQLNSLEFSSRYNARRLVKYQTMSLVQRHQYDTGSLQAQIAALTVHIRFMQQESYAEDLRRFPEKRAILTLKCDKRKKLLKQLSSHDYKLFEWLLEKLNILYKPYPVNAVKLYRYDSLRKLVSMRCENLRKRRMAEYKAKLDAQKEAFLTEKRSTLQWIKEVQQKLNEEVTVDPDTGMIEPPEPKKSTDRKTV